ncbi:MAG: hypothetical protein EG828_09630, partial [Deltaproteobacteria bacterium]|nr:hypothetical protein [Deltaproteobacteria bacterium]
MKLTVVISRKDHSETSFIKLGPIDYLKSIEEQLVKVYPWKVRYSILDNAIVPSYVKADLDAVYDDVFEDIMGELPDKNRKTKFSIKNNIDYQLLILDLLDLFLATTTVELISHLNELGFAISERRLKQLLFLLESFKLVIKTEYGGFIYFTPGINHERKYLNYSFLRTGYAFDR